MEENMNKKKIIITAILFCLTFAVASCVVTYNISYKHGYDTGNADGYNKGYNIGYNKGYDKGYEDNRPRGSDGSPIVYVTKSGTKYHKEKCDYLANSSVEISREQAENKGYTPCSKCRPDRIK